MNIFVLLKEEQPGLAVGFICVNFPISVKHTECKDFSWHHFVYFVLLCPFFKKKHLFSLSVLTHVCHGTQVGDKEQLKGFSPSPCES